MSRWQNSVTVFHLLATRLHFCSNETPIPIYVYWQQLLHFNHTHTHMHTHTHTQPFYGSLDFVQDNEGEPIPEETFTHSHLSWSSFIPHQLPPSITIHGILIGRPYYRSSLWHDVSSVVCLSVTFCIVAKRYVLAKKCLKEWIGN